MAHDAPRPGWPGPFRGAPAPAGPGSAGADPGRSPAPEPSPGGPPSGSPAPPPTGSASPNPGAASRDPGPLTAPAGGADDELSTVVEADLATLSDLPLDRHPEVYARLHTTLTDALAATADPGR